MLGGTVSYWLDGEPFEAGIGKVLIVPFDHDCSLLGCNVPIAHRELGRLYVASIVVEETQGTKWVRFDWDSKFVNVQGLHDQHEGSKNSER